ncbi:leucine rich repeat (LRR) protein [Prosthecobacter fusiformis]|uniref:Leucine rich repeat (LRR) protein n=1 Tax=Prosthecobacter fusiformis TaxID=48464 RepID=A0A4R7S473_9BACT|nr:c-type cytochrome domain-containing protein [Prosthecobacter fusiformis]TDU73212.1 leucine rich repeat (LRR) protein [Prosthecobacter fusiformis]
MRFRSSFLCFLALASIAGAADSPPAADPALKAVVDKVNATGASLMPVAADGKAYRFTALNVAKDFGDDGLAALAPAADKITSVDLARTKVTDAGLAAIGQMKNLKELHLENTGITDAGLDHLKGLASLEYLNLYNTKVTDAGAQKLAGLTKLKALYLWQTGVTKAGVAQLKGKLPGAQINTGWTAEDDAKPVAIASAPVVAEAAAGAAATEAAAPVAAGKLDAAVAAKAVLYKDVIAPILEAKCVSCHGAEKKKGKLQLHDFASIMKGGSEGDVNVVPGKPDDSLLISRIKLPEDDDDHMPPSDEPQVTKEELALLKWWIASGASDTVTVAAAKPTPEVEPALAVVLGKAAPAAKPAPVAEAAPAPAAAPAAVTGKLDPAIAAKAVIYKDVIAPIMEAKCTSCHGAEKKKGKLQLHDFASIMKGGSEGDVNVVPGKPDESLLLARIKLPEDDDDHMPPTDEPQVSKEELALLKWWIESGASDTATVASMKTTPDVESALAAVLGGGAPKVTAKVTKEEKPKAKPLTDAEKKQVAEITAKIQALNASLMPLAQDTEQLRLSVINATDKFGDAELALLEPIAAQIVWVDLARSKVTDKAADTLAKMTALERLHLENTKVSDTGLAKLAVLQNLEYLNLYGTKTTDAGIAKLANAKGLKKLFVWQTGVTKAGATALEGQLPGLKVNVGLSEAEIAQLTAPPPAPPPAPEMKKEEPKADAKKDKPKAEPKKEAAKPTAKKPAAADKADTPPAAKPKAPPTKAD